jgi:hypothetical protein
MITEQQLRSLPLLLDGSDGSLWPVNHNDAHWDLCLSLDGTARRRFVRVSDLLKVLGISPIESTEVPHDDSDCATAGDALP